MHALPDVGGGSLPGNEPLDPHRKPAFVYPRRYGPATDLWGAWIAACAGMAAG